MNYIANNKEINIALKNFYNHEISAVIIGDIYFKNKLYSAASSFYNVELFNIINTNKFKLKSYCFQRMGECYLLQQSDQEFSGWQLNMIYESFMESLSFNQYNFHSYVGLANYYSLKNERKNQYHTYNKVLLHINEFDFTEADYDVLFNIALKIYDLAEEFFIIKYDYFNNSIIQFFIEINYDSEKIYELMTRIHQHNNYIDNFEKDIIQGNIYF